MWTDSDKRHAKEKYSITIFESDCLPERANDKSLPTSAHLVKYKIDGEIKYDIVMSGKMCHIFDFYWDHLRSDLLSIAWSAGTVNPKLWGYTSDQKKKK
jgi:hypothetical protein